MHHSSFIGHIASIYKPNVYVELGLYQGETLWNVIPHGVKCIGVDMSPNVFLEDLKRFSNVEIHYKTTDDFFVDFKGKNEGIDMAFIDADHNSVSALKDFENVMELLNPGGIVLMHDTDPISDFYINPGYCGDSYKLVDLFEQRNDINIITLPINEAGLSIITKKGNTRTQRRTETTDAVSYNTVNNK